MIYLRYQDQSMDEAKGYQSKGAAINAFEKTARELARYGQAMAATLHIGGKEELSEYPDFVLSLGPRGGLRCTNA